jgi:FkbM family methyltransferase
MKFGLLIGKTKLALDICTSTSNWPILFLNYFGLIKSKEITFKLKKEPWISIYTPSSKYDTSGFATVWEIAIKKNYNPRGFEIGDKDTVIDIGANMGVFSIYAAKRAKNGNVYSFEPFKEHYARLERDIKLNNLKNVHLFNEAVAKKVGKQSLFLSDVSSGMHSLYSKNKGKNNPTVNITTLNKVIKDNNLYKNGIDFLKIDCEGAEYDIIYSTSKNYMNKIKRISMEYEDMDDKKMNHMYMKRFLENSGFEVFLKEPDKKQGILYAINKSKLK